MPILCPCPLQLIIIIHIHFQLFSYHLPTRIRYIQLNIEVVVENTKDKLYFFFLLSSRKFL